MGEPIQLSVQRIANINAACASVGDNEVLDATISYRLGRLADYSESIVKKFRREQEKRFAAARRDNKKLTDQEKAEANEKLTEEMNSLMDSEEEINVPKLKYSDFVAKTDMRVGDREYKSGQVLVPIKFFSMMGDLIEDDKNLL